MANQVLSLPTELKIGSAFDVYGSFINLGVSNTLYNVQKFVFGDNNTTGCYGLAVTMGSANANNGGSWSGDQFVFGSSNTMAGNGTAWGGNVFAFGNSNLVANGYTYAFGKSNTIYGQYAYAFGEGNTLTMNAAPTKYTMVCGYGNYTSDTLASGVFGYQNTIGRSNNYDFIAGQGNLITDLSGAHWNAIFGQKNTVNGGDMNLVSGGNATAGHNVTGNNNIVGGGQGGQNTVSGFNNLVVGWICVVSGQDNIVSGQGCQAGGSHNIVNGRNSVGNGSDNCVVGYGNGSSGSCNGVFGEANAAVSNYALMYGRQNLIGAGIEFAMVGGHQSHASMYGQRSLASGWWGNNQHAQTAEVVFKVATTDANPTEVSNPAGGFITCEDNVAYTYIATITAKDTAGTDHASYRLKWSTVRGAGVATVTVDGLVKEIIFESQSAWDCDVTADTTNGRPALKVTGEVGKTLHWVVRLEITETY